MLTAVERVAAAPPPVHARFRMGTPCVVAFGDARGEHALVQELRDLLAPDVLERRFGDLRCLVADMAGGVDEVAAQRGVDVPVRDYFERRRRHSPDAPCSLYLTELYMRHIVEAAGRPRRPYAAAVAGLVCEEANWYQTDRPGRLESVFLGDSGTFGTLHRDTPLGWGWILVLSGCKRVLLFPPEIPDDGTVLAPAFDSHLRGHKAFRATLTPGDVELFRRWGAQEAVLRAGDLLVIPNGWWHQITNLADDTLSCVDMVLEPWLIHELCTFEPDPYRHAVPDVLREIAPHRADETLVLARRVQAGGADAAAARVRLWEQTAGLVQLLYGIECLAARMHPRDRPEFAALHARTREALSVALNSSVM